MIWFWLTPLARPPPAGPLNPPLPTWLLASSARPSCWAATCPVAGSADNADTAAANSNPRVLCNRFIAAPFPCASEPVHLIVAPAGTSIVYFDTPSGKRFHASQPRIVPCPAPLEPPWAG